MAQFRKGDMLADWKRAGLLLITANGTLDQQGALVMESGVARQARDRFPGLALALGRQIAAGSTDFTPYDRYQVCAPRYDLLVSPQWPAKNLGLFQVKGRFDMAISLSQVQESTTALMLWCAEHPGTEVWLNLPTGEARSIVRELPDRVVIWEID